MDRRELLVEMLGSRLQILVTGVNTRKIPEWNRVLNNFLTTSLIETMEAIEPAIDLCGEQGEYHTMVLDGPMFKKPVPYDRFLIQTRVSEMDDLAYIEFEERKG
jgi:diphthamide synthase (EF-2-diphthine--ammonia ligase)